MELGKETPSDEVKVLEEIKILYTDRYARLDIQNKPIDLAIGE